MNILKSGTLCVTVGPSGVNDGTLVRVVKFIGPRDDWPGIREGYIVETVSGRPFRAITVREDGGTKIAWHADTVAIGDRRNLRPLTDLKDETEEERELVFVEKGER